MRSKIMHSIAWFTAKHISLLEFYKGLIANIGAFAMKLANKSEYEYYQACFEQGQGLTELKALSAALEIKDLSKAQGGWEDHHGIGLEMVSHVLMDQAEWEPEDVHDFVERLSEGFFSFGAVAEDDIDFD